jgi:eukaryotic-like serine/threonine-protein kinase
MQATLSHYRILEEIGAGGMGVVYRAHDERLDRDVALKVLPSGILTDGASRKRFRKEALALSKLNHPNIAIVHDFDSEDGVDFLVEELIDGLSLDTMLSAGPLSEKEIVNLGAQLAEGIAAAHDHGIIHRDLKPANVRVTPEARLKILDFGLAMFLRGETSPTAVTESVSETRGISGTLPYMAPEQLLGDRVDARTDIWSAGCVLYEMAAGRRPFLGSGPALTEAILHHAPPQVNKLNPKIRARLCAVIEKCLHRDPRKRYQSAEQIAFDLRRAVSGKLTEMRLNWPRRIAAPVITLAIALAVLAGVRTGRSLHKIWFTKQTSQVTAKIVPHESYLAGMEYLNRWDKTENLDSAIRLFEQAVSADESFALGHSAMGQAHWAKYRLDRDPKWMEQAEQDCRHAAELNRQLPAVYVTLALVHNGRGKFDLALQEVQQALQLEPRNADALLAEAAVLSSMGQAEKAEITYKTATVLRPQDWSGHYELGVFYYRQRRYADAAGEFERVLEITPDNALAHATLGGMLQLLGKDAEAETHLKRSLDLQPSYIAYTNLGALYYRERRWEESVAMTRQALALNNNDWSAWLNLGLGYEWLNNETAARDAFDKELQRLEPLAKRNGEDAEIQVELGLLYSRHKARAKAVPSIEAALARDPENPSVLASAAEAYENLGDRNRALDLVKKALARGWTLAQLENDPGQRKLILDSRFREIAQQSTNNSKLSQ